MSKTIVVTGCSSGFGRQASEQLAGLGHRVYACMRDPSGRHAKVAGELHALVGMPAGTRPFRSVVGVDFGVKDRNAAVETFDAGLLQAAGLADFATLRVDKL